MRTTITLDDDVYDVVRAMSRHSGKKLGTVVSELVRRGLRPVEPVAATGLPTFEVPQGAEIIPGNRASELLAEEDVT